MNTLSIPARPFAFALPPGRCALIVIDMQRDFIEPGGFGESLGNDVSLLRAAVAPTQTLLSAWRERGWPIVHTRESHRPDLSDCPQAKRERGQPRLRIGDPGPMGRLLVRGEPGCEIVPELAPLLGEIVIDKPGKGAFHGTDLQATLQGLGVTHLVFAGVTTEVCVHTTLRAAIDHGYGAITVADACAASEPQLQAPSLAMIEVEGGIFGAVADSTELIALMSRFTDKDKP
jgi:nicotinamidase-related amidase